MNYVELKWKKLSFSFSGIKVLIELCRIEIEYKDTRVGTLMVLIELCRIEIIQRQGTTRLNMAKLINLKAVHNRSFFK